MIERTPELHEYLQPSEFIDSAHPDIVAYANANASATDTLQQQALSLYYAVRDDLRYNPYALGIKRHDFLASNTLRAGEGWCVTKAIVLAAVCRARGIPARVGFADVRNHLSTERLRAAMKTDVFYFHGYTSLHLNNIWVKATPAFNIELCEKFGLRALEFDGVNDSLYQPYDLAGNQHMEYLHDRGEHVDLPLDELLRVFAQHYPDMLAAHAQKGAESPQSADWEAEVDHEISSR
tara:strand:- start:86555 stop:87262 length:708 start_codon:yes stop_codon:yes gene_type:complete